MSKREHKIDNDIPFSENLIFHAPLAQGDLTDHVSGNVGYPINPASGNLDWDDTNQAYRLHTTNNYTNALVFDTPNLATLFGSSKSWTWTAKIKKISTTIYVFLIGYSKSGDSIYDYGYSLSHLSSIQSYISSSQFDRFTLTYNGDSKINNFYKNGLQIKSETLHASWSGAPVNWRQHYTEHVSLASSIGGNFVTDAYMKDARLYNRCLTAQEVAQL